VYDNSCDHPQQQQQQQQQQTLQRDSSLRSTITTATAASGIEFKSDAPTPSRAANSKDNKDRVSILVVDDSNISSKLAVRKLAALGHDTVHAENGQVALDILRAPGGHNVSKSL
jgi:PleD family two-component response regulator